MLHDPARHEPLSAPPWDPERAREMIGRIVADIEHQFIPEHGWLPHPRDVDPGENAAAAVPCLYYGGCGVIWALHYLQDLGAAQLSRDYRAHLASLLPRTRAWLGDDHAAERASYLMGDTPVLMLSHGLQPSDEAADTLATLIAGNQAHPARELMWGAPGTMLAALFLHRRSGETRWAELYRRSAGALWSQLQWSEAHQCHYWAQDLYGRHSSYLDAVHGFVATASVLIQGRHLLAADDWAAWQACIGQTITRTADWENGEAGTGRLASWRAQLDEPAGQPPKKLMQFCHGAPGFVICLADFPGTELDELLCAAGEATWVAGPLTKGSNLCHGTGGNGYAFLKLYQRTGDERWLQRARAFAMHGIAQTEADFAQHGRMRPSLWTGDPGLAIYLCDCLRGEAAFPTLEVFYAESPGLKA